MQVGRRISACASQVLVGMLFLTVTPMSTDLWADDIVLKKGTPVKLAFVTTVSSQTAKIGDPVELKVSEDVKVGDTVIVPAGAQARGFVARAESGKFFGRGIINIYVGSVAGPNGLQIPLRGLWESIKDNGDISVTAGTQTSAEVDIDIPLTADSLATASTRNPPPKPQ